MFKSQFGTDDWEMSEESLMITKNDEEEEEVKLSRGKYDSLLEDRDKLNALEQCGVDNWEGWGDAMELLEEWGKDV